MRNLNGKSIHLDEFEREKKKKILRYKKIRPTVYCIAEHFFLLQKENPWRLNSIYEGKNEEICCCMGKRDRVLRGKCRCRGRGFGAKGTAKRPPLRMSAATHTRFISNFLPLCHFLSSHPNPLAHFSSRWWCKGKTSTRKKFLFSKNIGRRKRRR